jgi:hypothetical protein
MRICFLVLWISERQKEVHMSEQVLDLKKERVSK